MKNIIVKKSSTIICLIIFNVWTAFIAFELVEIRTGWSSSDLQAAKVIGYALNTPSTKRKMVPLDRWLPKIIQNNNKIKNLLT